MSNLTFRPRPIDIHKQLPIVRKELDGTEVDAEIQGGVRRSVPVMPTGMEREDEEEAHIAEAIKQSLEARPERVDIPTPVVIIVEGYDTAPNPQPFVRPSTYLHYADKTPEEEDADIEYDAEPEDEVFLEQLNATLTKKGGTPLTEPKFEIIVDRLEKEAGRLEGQIPAFQAIERIIPGVKPYAMQAVYKYWIERRQQERTPLNHRFLKPPDPEDPDPYKAFRPRNDEKVKKKTRKNDQVSLVRMRQLRHEMERARTLLEMIKKRERLKRDYVHICEQIFEAQLAEPRDKFLEYTSSKDLFGEPFKKKQKKIPPKPPKPQNLNLSTDFLEEEDFLSDELSDESDDEGAPDWPPEDSFYAESAVDILSQKMNNASAIDLGPRLQFRGRCRIGRGGRIIFDRRPVAITNGISRSFETDEECPTRLDSLLQLYTSEIHPVSAGRSDPAKLLKKCEKLESAMERRQMRQFAMDTT
eukprot:TRINITY_DN10990_c0_g1_i1.p1 TRINITY_DN10990_c0_g1~~TRINITY_DN10990_c0_g1_i1.p1  ORF type:complete len:471 (+),score=133.82 TRINITY_DN10990_c0_g1_i1:1427-2839(+)